VSGLFDDVLGPKPAPRAQGGGLFDDVLGPRQAPNFGNVQSGVQTTEVPSIASIAAPPPTGKYRPGTLLGRSFNSLFGAVAPDSLIRAIDNYEGFDPTTPTGIAQAPASEAGDLTDMGLRSILRVPQLAGQLIDLIPNAGDATIRALGGDPDRSVALALLRQGLGGVSDAAQDPVRLADAAGFGRPSVSAEQTLDALDPRTDAGILDRLQTVGTFIPETLVGSGGDMAAAVAAPYAYLGARTNEIAETRAANDQRSDVSLADLAVAAPAAGVETLLERLTTGRLLPGGAVYAPGAGSVAGRIARETALQGGSGGIEELVPYLAETVGTERGATGREALATLVTGVLSEGALGAGAQGGAEVAQALQRPTPSAVAAEVPASPRQDAAPAVPPTTAPMEMQEAPAPEAPPAPVRPDMTAATRAIDNRLAALDEAAAGQIDEAEVSALNAERQELDDLVREQDRARREGIVQSLEARLTPEERATADARRQEIAAMLERHRAARTAADQAQRLRGRLESADTDAALYEVAREIDPTLGTPQAESFRAPAVKEDSAQGQPASLPASPQSAPQPASPPAQAAEAAPQAQQTAIPMAPQPRVREPTPAPVEPNPPAARTEPTPLGPVSQSGGRAPGSSVPPARGASAPTATPSVPAPSATVREPSSRPAVPPSAAAVPRAEAQREPMAETGDLTNSANPPRVTGIKNAVTDAERIAEGRDPIIREARKANRETVDEAVRALRETPTLGRETAARLASGGPVELKDEAVLLVHKVNLRKRRDAAAERAQSPDLSEEVREAARREYDDLVQQIDEVDQAAVRVGTESGRLLQLRRRMIAEDYSLPALERKLRMVVNRDLKPGERAELKEMADKVADLQRKLDAAESKQASAQVAEMLARLMKSSPGRGATLEQRRAAAAESRAALSAMASARGEQRSITPAAGKPGQARDALVDRLGRGVVRQLERDGVLKFEGPAGGSWDGATIRIGDVSPENALGVLLHEASHARLAEVMGADGYDRALRDLDALEEAGDATAVRAARRAARSGESGARLDDERLAYMVEEAAKANRTTGGVSAKARELVRRVLSAFRQWAATSPVYRALERLGLPRPTLQPDDFVAFARASLRRLMDDAATPEARRLRGKIGALETELRTDRLTGMRNRRAFDEDASLGWPSVVAIDMDGLKRLNDAIGHEAADNVMRALADELRASEGDGARFYRRSGDEFAARFRDPAEAERVMADLQAALEDMQVQLDVADADGGVRSYTYQGIGISYGTGQSYETADAAANRQKAARLEAGIREAPRADGPSRRLREDSPRPGGRRAGDPPAEVAAQRSIADQTQTPAFRRWFGDSKVVDENGEPLVVYHGANAKFDAFDPSKIGALNGRSEGPGFYFTTDKNVAKMYEDRGKDGALYEVFLRIEKPMPYDTPALSRRKVAALLAETARQEIAADEDIEDWRDGYLANYVYTPGFRTIEDAANEAAGMFDGSDNALDQISGIIGGGVASRIVNAAVKKTLGFDGYVATGFSNAGTSENTIYVAMDPTQIKSATSNRGTFDPNDPNIMRSIPDGEPDAGAPVPAGVDPVAFFHLARMGAFHYADGARDMAEWTRRMQADLGPAAAQYRDALPAAFEASKAQASRPASGVETVAEALEAIGDRRRPRDVKRVVRAVVAEGMRGEAQVFEAAAQALDMETDDVRGLFAQPEPGPKTLSEAQAEINRLRKALRDAQRPDPETRYQNQRARDFQRRIAELEQRIAAGDFAKRERVERELTKENERLRYELEQAKTRFHQYALEAEFAQRTPLGKLWGETVAGINFSRAIMTSLDLSAVFRQGGFIAFGNPGRAAKAIPQMFRSLVSEKSDTLAMMDIMNRENAPLYKRAGLQLTGIGGDALSRVEETYASRWVDKLSPWAGGGLIRGSGRAYTAFLNRLRADSFDAMVAALARDGSNPTKEEIKAIANYINVATGRGDIAGYQPGEVLTATFFAPRLVASRFQLLAGQPLYGGSNRTRKMIAQEYARFLLGVSVAITLAAMMRDDEDETKLIELDPRSSDFGKVRFGNTYLDPLAGLAQVTVFLARVGTGETRRGADAATSEAMAESGIPMMDRDLGLRPLRDEYRLTDIAPGLGDGQPLGKVRYGGTDILRVGTNFIRSKLAPVPGWAINVTTGKDFKGDPISALEATGQLVVPMSAGNLVDVMEANGMMRGTAINLLGILGFSVQYRKPDAEELAEQQGGILGAVGVGTAEDLEE
jgi:diguanylate cyclase (GGDEF)-like protein